MPSFKHILFPVDFSQQDCVIAPHVVCMAHRYGARVTMLHAMELPTGAYAGWPEYVGGVDFPALADDRRQRLDSFLKSEFQSIDVNRVMSEGDPAWRIAEYAKKERVGLIMMRTHGYGPFRRLLLGSVTAKVLHDVECPVWTSAHTPESPPPPAGYRSVLCALDYTPQDLSLLRWASLFVCEQGATLKLTHAI